MRVFDIGANIGYYALMELNTLSEASQLYAFEPVPSNIDLLKKNLKLNGYEAPTILNVAVSSFDGEQDFYFSTASNLGSFHKLAVNQGINSAGVSKVKTISLRTACLTYGSPDLIRMDVEGHEVEILSQLAELAEQNVARPVVIFETHLKQYLKSDNFSITLRKLFENGYRVSLFASSQESGSEIIMNKGYKPFKFVRTDGMRRGLFANLSDDDAIEIITRSGGIRTVVLSCE
jgi:FkbM family methyltransferase